MALELPKHPVCVQTGRPSEHTPIRTRGTDGRAASEAHRPPSPRSRYESPGDSDSAEKVAESSVDE